jgi:starvation-inducible outer membrane lipoprotein
MFSHNQLQRWTACLALTATLSIVLSGCAAVPRRYIWIAEPDITLTKLSTSPQAYVGKVVLLGGTIIEHEEHEQVLLLRLKNRPLDQDYKPHSPADVAGPEAGSYWVMVPKQQVPPKYRSWGRATVVGRVTGEQRYRTEPVLMLLYMRGWTAGGDHGVWENIDPNYRPLIPGGINLKN